MPIKPENKKRYPENWDSEIRPHILERDGHKCKFCGVPNYAIGSRNKDGVFIPITGNIDLDCAGQGLLSPSLDRITYREAKEILDVVKEDKLDGKKYIMIVLTVAHLNHIPEDCRDENLAALCQKCHNNYDIEHRKQSRKEAKKIQVVEKNEITNIIMPQDKMVVMQDKIGNNVHIIGSGIIKFSGKVIDDFYQWFGEENVRYFKHLKGLTGNYSPVLKLNSKRKFMPVHPVHLREGMVIRNWMRGRDEFKDFNDHDFDNNWTKLVELTVEKYG